MKNKAIVWTLFVVGLVFVCSVVYFTDPARRREPPAAVITNRTPEQTYCAEPNQVVAKTEPNEAVTQAEPNEATPQAASVKDTFQDEPEAHALYDKMIETMRNAESLSYQGKFTASGKGPTYEIWMKKPNYFRVETVNMQGVECGTLVGDGDHLWIYWPEGNTPVSNKQGYADNAGEQIYMKRATPLARHSIGHEVARLRAGIGMTVIDPSTFHGYTDSLVPYMDGAKSWYTETVEGHECDVIEVSFMDRQRIWYLWLSKEDHLPRKLKEVVRVSSPLVGYEYWTDVKINTEIPDEKFVWSPPAGWVQWTPPEPDLELLKPGTEAPDFELLLADETKVKLSDYRGKIVWFYMWRLG
jgi:outer membrane lipoprotein-sorting protein